MLGVRFCKTSIREFKSRRRLHIVEQERFLFYLVKGRSQVNVVGLYFSGSKVLVALSAQEQNLDSLRYRIIFL